MRGVDPILGFGLLGLIAVVLISYVSPLDGFCGEKSRPCGRMVSADPGVVVEVTAFGMVGLVIILVVVNGLFRLFARRPTSTES